MKMAHGLVLQRLLYMIQHHLVDLEIGIPFVESVLLVSKSFAFVVDMLTPNTTFFLTSSFKELPFVH